MKRYSVKGIWDTLQGEGARAGTRAVFCRLTSCNAWTGRPEDRTKGKGACSLWCDTDFVGGTMMTDGEILRALNEQWPSRSTPGIRRSVVVTGGEPALQLDVPLLAALHGDGWHVAVETNGSVDNPALAQVDWLTVSPKVGMPLALTEGRRPPDELKVVLPGAAPGTAHVAWTDADLLAMEHRLHPRHLFVNPQDEINPNFVGVSTLLKNHNGELGFEYETNVKRCVEFVKAHPQWRVGVQLHKLLNMP